MPNKATFRAICLASFATATARQSATTEFDWSSIEPSSNLQYHDCYEDFKCARLLLPMDWIDDNKNETVATAIIKLPAVVDETDDAFGGTIVSQPGGPGVSGTSYALGRSHRLRDTVDIPGKKHYEIVSFDGRGLGHSTPKISCYPGDLYYTRKMAMLGNGALDLHPKALPLHISLEKADAVRCERAHGDFLSYVGTADVARDMVGLIDKIDEFRKANFKHDNKNSNAELSRLELRSNSNDKELPRLQYIGISYGTILGNFFASMFPERVGRMVLDGVCDVNDMIGGPGFMTDTNQVDEIVDRFFDGCFESGGDKCALVRPDDKSGKDISSRVWTWADTLDDYPLVTIKGDGDTMFVRSGEIRNVFRWNMYNANYLSRPMALMLNEAIEGNATTLTKTIAELYEIDDFRMSDREPLIPQDGAAAVLCVDGVDVSNNTLADWRLYLQQQLSISSIAGAMWATVRMSCAGWKARPKWPFTGPFISPKPSKSPSSPEPGRPAAPLLFMSTTYDPATPLENARAMSKMHPESGLLIQESTGHCVVLGPIGPCAKSALSKYFDTGEVPATELTCSDTRGPWDDEE